MVPHVCLCRSAMSCKLQRTTAEASTFVCICKADTLGTLKALLVNSRSLSDMMHLKRQGLGSVNYCAQATLRGPGCRQLCRAAA